MRKWTYKDIQEKGIAAVDWCGKKIAFAPGIQKSYFIKKNKTGDIIVHIWDGKYPAELRMDRLVWVWYNGELAGNETIVHEDGDPSNCRLDNLKKVTVKEARISKNKYTRLWMEREWEQQMAIDQAKMERFRLRVRYQMAKMEWQASKSIANLERLKEAKERWHDQCAIVRGLIAKRKDQKEVANEDSL